MSNIYRYEFDEKVPREEVEASLVLALIGTEALHGETATQLGVSHYFDTDKRVCIVDAENPVASAFNTLFMGFLRNEFSSDAFQVRRVSTSDTALAHAA